ncbi:MAG: hypothetical protein R3F54_18885 [Alphaproteobacteria bacterium]
MTLVEIQGELERRFDVTARLSFSFIACLPAQAQAQKSLETAEEQDQPDVAAKRRRWRAWQLTSWIPGASPCSSTRRRPPPT